MLLKLKYLQTVKDRYGGYRTYFRRKGHPSLRLPDKNHPNFLSAYHNALAASEKPREIPTLPHDTLDQCISAWTRSPHFQGLRASTKNTYRNILTRIQKEAFAQFKLKDFERRHIRKIRDRIADRPAAANRELKLLRAIFRFAIDEELIATDPTSGIKLLREVQEGQRSWSEEEVAQYLAYWGEGTKQRCALLLMLYTGQRRGDIVRLGWRHVDGEYLRFTQEKTGTSLAIPILPPLRAALNLCPKCHPSFLMAERLRPKPYSANGFYNNFVDWVRASGLSSALTPHGLRKTAATRLAEAGCTPHQIAAITGHKTLSEVSRYTKQVSQERMADEAFRALSRREG